MKYWTYYTDVVRYLERIEAGQSQKREGPAYLVWQDGDGPSMIIGPGVEWYRGDGPPPDFDAPVPSAATASLPRDAPECVASIAPGPKPIEGEAPQAQGAQENKPMIPTTVGLRRIKDINLNNRIQPPNL